MRIILGGQYISTLDATSVKITRAMTDPVPTCTVVVEDNTSSLAPQAMQELLVLDEQVTPNPTTNLILNPTLNPYTTTWQISGNTSGITFSQLGGGGVTITLANASLSAIPNVYQSFLPVIPQVSYVVSYTVQASSPVNLVLFGYILWQDASLTGISISYFTTNGTIPPTTPTRVSTTGLIAPANAAFALIVLGVETTSSTNSGAVSFLEVQFEPQWFPTLSYPTPFCGPAQTNCQQMPNGMYIRQYRKFAGFVTHVTYQNYHGNKREVLIGAVGYAWLAGLILANDSFSNKSDATIITSLLTTYLNGFCTTGNIVTGVSNVTSLQANWDDLRTLFDGLCGLSGFYWTIDYYWNFIYAPPGYFAMPISLICDNSSTPDLVTSFPAYHFSREVDFTQPGATILVIGGTSGSTTFSAEVIDSSTTAQYGITSGYTFTPGKMFMRKVNDSTLLSNADCTQRAMAELIQYDLARTIVHLSTNVEVLAGESIQVTSNTDGLSQTTLLIQQVTAQWIGTSETLTDQWEYQANLGAVNRAATAIMSRIFRTTQRNVSAPPIGATTLALLEPIGMTDTEATASVTSSYVQTIQADQPIAYYRLSNLEGTVADDWSGNGLAGTLNNSPTLGVGSLLTDSAPADTVDRAIAFASASSQYIQLPNGSLWPSGNNAWSLECWCKPTNATNANNGHLITIGNPGTNAAAGAICQTSTGGWGVVTWGGTGHDFQGNGTSVAGTIYYLVATYDGAGNLLLYVSVGGTTTAYGPFSPGTLNLSASHQSIGDSWNGSAQRLFFDGVIDEVAIYTYKLTASQVSAHYAAGRP
jgi:hypothetical protein